MKSIFRSTEKLDEQLLLNCASHQRNNGIDVKESYDIVIFDAKQIYEKRDARIAMSNLVQAAMVEWCSSSMFQPQNM